MKKYVIILMILSSLFVGVKIKTWTFLFQFELIDFPTKMLNHSNGIEILLWCILILSHIGVFSLLFISNRTLYSTVLKIIPLIFVLSYSLINFIFFIFLIPFLILWLIALIQTKK
jgi:hypothetical protein